MALTGNQMAAAERIVDESDTVEEFKTRANVSDVPWWEAAREQITALKNKAKNAEVKGWVDAYCRKISISQANAYISMNVIAKNMKDPAFWLKYYLKESNIAPERARNKEDVATVLSQLLSPNVRGGIVRTGELCLKTSLDQIDPDRLRGMLKVLLEAGFAKIPGNAEQFSQKDTSHVHLMNFLRQTAEKDDYLYGWRCDSRKYEDILESEGFQAKVRSEKYATANGMRERWHPFSDEATRSYMWYRMGQNDNCLYTIVSIGDPEGDFKSYLPFPLIKDSPWEVADMSVPCQLTRQVANKLTGKDEARKEWQYVTLGVSYSWLYLFIYSKLLLADTNKIQEHLGEKAFPEKGAAGIPLENIYGAIKFMRIHHAAKAEATDAHGLSAFPVEFKYAIKHKFAQTPRWGDEAKNKLGEVFFPAALTEPVHLRWTPHGYALLEDTFEVGTQKVTLNVRSFREAKPIAPTGVQAKTSTIGGRYALSKT